MKNFIIAIIVLLAIKPTLGQVTFTPSCYNRLTFTVQNYGLSGAGYTWGVKVTNYYGKAIQFRYRLNVGGEYCGSGTLTYYLKSGETYTNDWGKIKALIASNNSNDFNIEVSEVCFEGWDCYKYGYSNCNGYQEGKTSSTNSSPNSTTSLINANTSTNSNFSTLIKKGRELCIAEKPDEALTYLNQALNQASTQSDKDEVNKWIIEANKLKAWQTKNGAKHGASNTGINNQQADAVNAQLKKMDGFEKTATVLQTTGTILNEYQKAREEARRQKQARLEAEAKRETERLNNEKEKEDREAILIKLDKLFHDDFQIYGERKTAALLDCLVFDLIKDGFILKEGKDKFSYSCTTFKSEKYNCIDTSYWFHVQFKDFSVSIMSRYYESPFRKTERGFHTYNPTYSTYIVVHDSNMASLNKLKTLAILNKYSPIYSYSKSTSSTLVDLKGSEDIIKTDEFKKYYESTVSSKYYEGTLKLIENYKKELSILKSDKSLTDSNIIRQCLACAKNYSSTPSSEYIYWCKKAFFLNDTAIVAYKGSLCSGIARKYEDVDIDSMIYYYQMGIPLKNNFCAYELAHKYKIGSIQLPKDLSKYEYYMEQAILNHDNSSKSAYQNLYYYYKKGDSWQNIEPQKDKAKELKRKFGELYDE